jgi:hypothetical protein
MLLFLAVPVSTGGGVAYAVATKDVGTGIGLSRYIIINCKVSGFGKLLLMK